MGVNVKYSDETFRLVGDLLSGMKGLTEQAIKLYPELSKNKVRENLAKALFMQWTECSTEEELKQKRSEETFLQVYSDLLADSCVIAYLGLFDNDKNWNTLKKDKKDSIVAKLLEEKESKLKESMTDLDNTKLPKVDLSEEEKAQADEEVNMEFSFGYSDLFEIVQSCVESIENSESSKSSVQTLVESNMLSDVRSIDYQTYLSDGYIDKDVALIALMGNKQKSELVEIIVKMIRNDDTYNSYIKEILSNIKSTYLYFFQDSFGLRPYEGVITYTTPYCYHIDDFNRLEKIKGVKANFDNISKCLKENWNVVQYKDRQFNIETIMNSKETDTLYFPLKILEYAKGRELTYNLTTELYRKNSYSLSWESYWEHYVKGQIEFCLIEMIYKTIEKNFDATKLDWLRIKEEEKDLPFSFASDSFQESYKPNYLNGYESQLEDYITETDFINKARVNLNKLQKALCSGAVITNYNKLGGKINSIAIRVVDTTNTLKKSLTKDLFSALTLNKSMEFFDAIDFTDGKQNEQGSKLPYHIYEFKHDFDTQVSNAEPLFGYTAIEMYIKQGKPLGWNKILLGETRTGSPLFASIGGADDIHLQENVVHNIVAGSRSGKGVMTMNMLASAVASGKPIFYIDRKPDMAIMFYNLTKGNMFIVNGGSMDDDNKHLFQDDGDAIKGWRQAYKKLPQYIKDNLCPDETYYGRFGDFVYYRAVIFVLGIIFARAHVDTPTREKLGGDRGICLVVDEFKNWQETFEKDFFTSEGVCYNNYLTSADKDTYDKLNRDINLYNKQLETETKEKTIADLTGKLQFAKNTLNSKFNIWNVYCTALIDSLRESMTFINSQKSASFKNKEAKFTDIFVISQSLSREPMLVGDAFKTKKDGKFDARFCGGGKSPLRGVFYNGFADVDYIMGYNADEQHKYFGATDGVAKDWIQDNRNWGYTKEKDVKLLTTSTPSDAVFFKPYLVLNGTHEKDPNDEKSGMRQEVTKDGKTIWVEDKDYEYVRQCKERVDGKVAGLWETIRLKHLGNRFKDPKGYEKMYDEATRTENPNKHYDELNEGMGFKGLARLTKEAAYKGEVLQGKTPSFTKEFDGEIDLKESMDIANFVAKKLGYKDYKEYLFDFTPKGIFSVDNISDILANKLDVTNYKSRVEAFFTYNFWSSDSNELETNGEDKPTPLETSTESNIDKLNQLAKIKEFEEQKVKQQESVNIEPLNPSEQAIKTVDDVPPMSEEEEDALIAAYTTESKDYAGSMKSETLTDTITGNRIVYNNVGELFYNNLFALLDIASETSLEVYGNTDINNCKKIIKDAEDDKEFVYVLLDYVKEENPDAEVILKNE